VHESDVLFGVGFVVVDGSLTFPKCKQARMVTKVALCTNMKAQEEIMEESGQEKHDQLFQRSFGDGGGKNKNQPNSHGSNRSLEPPSAGAAHHSKELH
jgi:hypothetical protein